MASIFFVSSSEIYTNGQLNSIFRLCSPQVIKSLLHTAGLNVPFTGGLSSYTVFLMACTALDSCVANEARASTNTRIFVTGMRPSVGPDIQTMPTALDDSQGVDARTTETALSGSNCSAGSVVTSPSGGVTKENQDEGAANNLANSASAFASVASAKDFSSPASDQYSFYASRVSEGKLLVHFLTMYKDLDPTVHGIGAR